MNPNVRAALFSLLAFAIFAAHDVVIKLLGATYSPFQIVFFAGLFGFPLVTITLLRDHTVDTLLPKHPWWLLARTLATVVTGAGAFYAFSVLPLAQVYAIVFATPLLITIFAIPMLKETVGFRRWIAVLVGLAGVIVVLQPGSTVLEWGHLAALLAAFSAAFASIIVRKIGREERSVVMMIYPLVANVFLMALLLPFVYVPMPLGDLGLNFIVAAGALIASGCLIAAYKSGEAAVVAPMQYSQILWASFYGFFFFGETLDQWTLIGAAIIIASGLYIVLRESMGGTSSTTPVLRTRTRVGTVGAPRVSSALWRWQAKQG